MLICDTEGRPFTGLVDSGADVTILLNTDWPTNWPLKTPVAAVLGIVMGVPVEKKTDNGPAYMAQAPHGKHTPYVRYRDPETGQWSSPVELITWGKEYACASTGGGLRWIPACFVWPVDTSVNNNNNNNNADANNSNNDASESEAK
ncbi:hypothetical protein BTVI_116983 [Pitangus sulphuratus]|nr:hypothetical protein BTVI_116983 [Pitangus sulphuratus]